MKNLVKQISILFILVLSVREGYCQNNYATNVSTTVTDEQKLFVNFDIVANDGSKYFHVVLVLNYEGEQIIPNPNNLFGDFGHVITPGDKIIYWDFGGEFKKDINRMKVQVLAYKENAPEARFLSSPVGGNFFAPCEIQFTNNSINSDRYEWDFGDVSSGIENNSFEENPSHVFKSKGRYTISLTVYNTNLDLKNTFYETLIIKEYPPILADFKIIGFDNLKKQSLPITIEFLNKSVNADTYNWDFGDPASGRNKNTSTDESPFHKFRNPGQYQIALAVKNSANGLTSEKTMEIVLPGRSAKIGKETEAGEISEYDRQKKMKTIWLASTFSTFAAGGGVFLKSKSLHNEYKTTTNNAEDIRKKYETLDKIYPALWGATVVSGIMTYVHAKKQSKAKVSLSFMVCPANNARVMQLTYNF